jgi:hypothetical protein
MIGTTTRVFDIQTVRSIQPSNGAVVITFTSGLVGSVPQNHPDRGKVLYEAEFALQQRWPVGVMMDRAGHILDLNNAHESLVDRIRQDEENQSRLMVCFWGYSPVCYLTFDHPEFDRIRATLEHAIAKGTRVWLANHMHMVEGETEIWWKLMDVRPLEPVPPGA